MQRELELALAKSIKAATGSAFEIQQVEPCGGGCINDAVILHGTTQNYFVKLNTAEKLEMFVAEAAGLEAMTSTETIYAPSPIVYGTCGDKAYLVLEALKFGGAGDWQTMGRQLANLHRNTAPRFGWERDNTIGSTAQRNSWMDKWAEFFRDQRLRFQFELAHKNGYHFEAANRLLEFVSDILMDHQPEPSLLHGDLWSGNAGFLSDGTPVIYDPACYYGDRETDLAFSEFFGGFPSGFYQGYEDEWSIPKGYERRKILYNLYHVLNHTNLFGGGYAEQARQMIRQLLN